MSSSDDERQIWAQSPIPNPPSHPQSPNSLNEIKFSN